MGSFNTACFASGQVIATGDKAYLMPILQASSYEEVKMTYNGKRQSMLGIACMSCYPHAFWEPYGAFIEAEYNDYGRFSLADTPLNRLRVADFLLDLHSKVAKVSQGENECHEVPFDLPKLLKKKAPLLTAGVTESRVQLVEKHKDSAAFFSELEVVWEAVWDVAAEYRLFAVNHSDELRPLQLAVMHAEAYNKLVKDGEERQRAVFKKVLEATKVFTEAPVSADPEAAEEQRLSLFWRMSSRVTSGLARLGSFEGMEYHCEVEPLDVAVEAFCAGKLDQEGLFAAVKPVLDARAVMTGLDNMNLRLTPQVYSGQDYSNEAGRDYAKFVQEVSAAVTQQRRERFGEEFDDE